MEQRRGWVDSGPSPMLTLTARFRRKGSSNVGRYCTLRWKRSRRAVIRHPPDLLALKLSDSRCSLGFSVEQRHRLDLDEKIWICRLQFLDAAGRRRRAEILRPQIRVL